jgi:hypothetical protein
LITIRSDLGERATSNCTRVLEKNDSQIRCCRNDRHCWLKPAPTLTDRSKFRDASGIKLAPDALFIPADTLTA